MPSLAKPHKRVVITEDQFLMKVMLSQGSVSYSVRGGGGYH